MSIARIYTTKGPVRKDGLTCGRCGDPIRKGIDRRRTFAVGFRGYEQTRCMKQECTPSNSELESSAVAAVYAAQEGVDFGGCESEEDVLAQLEAVADACDEVADEYESNEMYEINPDLQERAETVRNAGDELRNWTFDGESEPEQDDFLGEDEEEDVPGFEEAHAEWVQAMIDAAQEALDSMELP